ncbi:class I lanthipeptide [Chitinophaga nivalis]|uniref:Class I lanthipeptide n=1 Tax=Chitinophaga nivalis TaxID=2991709 RepID=A0ABT3IJF6_9BACT|nr:class I lanthipeptide [Chitinophaga nivalis]MCW3466209.1 class I lanthipeptide [Chitinophaga nivalis]MCW3484100.1 class I lanthipeptide [Chitinophaga nivalis]
MKKKVSLSKKLFLSKATVAELNQHQQQSLAGGALPLTRRDCQITAQESCITMRPGQEICIYC